MATNGCCRSFIQGDADPGATLAHTPIDPTFSPSLTDDFLFDMGCKALVYPLIAQYRGGVGDDRAKRGYYTNMKESIAGSIFCEISVGWQLYITHIMPYSADMEAGNCILDTYTTYPSISSSQLPTRCEGGKD